MEALKHNNKFDEMVRKIRNARNKLTLLDFDGTLVDFTAIPAYAIPSKELLYLLQNIAEKSDNKLIIITGRRADDIDSLVGHLPIDIIAEHGAMIRENSTWRQLIEGNSGWKKETLPIIRNFEAISPNSFIEEKPCSLAWHYRNVESLTGKENSRKLIKVLEEFAFNHDLKILDGNKIVEIISSKINKGAAVRCLLDKKDYDYILSIGDDETDEDMFRVLLNYENAFTVKIGPGNTCAKVKVENIQQALSLLEHLHREAE